MVNALLGGVGELVREKMKNDGIYAEFIQITKREYGMVFGHELAGEDVELCLLNLKEPVRNVTDFTMCN